MADESERMNATPFQTECKRQLLQTISKCRLKVVEHAIEGENERYIRIRIQEPAVEFFVYEDECGIQGKGTDIRFERPDFSSSDDLVAAFLRSIRKLAEPI